MAVLVEAISVIVRCDALAQKFKGGFKAYVDWCRTVNDSLCSDGELARIGFVKPEEAQGFVDKLGFMGLRHLRDGACVDIVVADQRAGLLNPCDWADYGLADLPGTPAPRVAACRLTGTKVAGVSVPDGWRYDTSISKEAGVQAKRPAPLAVLARRPGGAAPPIAQLLGLRPVKK